MRALTLLTAVAVALVLPVPSATAAAADPYLDGLAPANEIRVDDAADLAGAPDGRLATVYGRRFGFLVLDFGAGEEVLGDVEVHYELDPWEVFGFGMDVYFLDRDGRNLGRSQLVVGTWDTDGTTVITSPTTRPYRYLKILTPANMLYIDAMRAAALAS